MKRIRLKSLLTVVLSLPYILITNLSAKADYIHQTLAEYTGTIMEFHISEKNIKIILEIDKKDKKYFSNLLANKNSNTENNLLKTGKQQPLIGNIETIETRKRTPRGNRDALPTTDLMGNPVNIPQISPNVTYVEIVYPLTNKPPQLILSPPLEANQKYPVTSIGFITYHEQIPITNYWYLSRPEILNIDWEDPWYSKFKNPNLTRPHPSSLLSYLYIEPYEVRHEILIRIRDLADFINYDLTNIKTFTPDILEQIKKQAINYFESQPEMTIDGKIVKSIINRINFLETDKKGLFQVVKNSQELPLNSAIIGIDLIYPVQKFPDEVSVNWDMFNKKITTIPTITTDPAGPFPYILKLDDKILTWKNSLTNYVIPQVEYLPVSSQFNFPLGLLIGLGLSIYILIIIIIRKQQKKSINKLTYGLPFLIIIISIITNPLAQLKIGKPQFLVANISQEEEKIIFTHLLKNIYRAFDFRTESDIYDKLAISLEGEILTDVYLQISKSMELENQGGAVATVENIEITDIKKETSSSQKAQAYRTKWIANGTLSHWGHRHNRENQYEAIFTISPINNNWKITDMELLEETRIK